MITTAGRVLTLGFFIGAAWSLGGSGCERDVDDHCANLSGDASCRGYFADEARPFCSKCASAYHGCVDEPPDEECWAKGSRPSDPPVDDTGTTGPEPVTTGSSTDTGSDDLPVMTGDAEGTDSGSDGPASECGNGILEPGEDCDGEDLGGADCSVVGSRGDGLACNDECLFDPRMCEGFECGDEAIQALEECDGDNLAGYTCADLERVATRGTLSCSNCLFNTTECCIPVGEPCAANSDCCSDVCDTLIPGVLEKTCKDNPNADTGTG